MTDARVGRRQPRRRSGPCRPGRRGARRNGWAIPAGSNRHSRPRIPSAATAFPGPQHRRAQILLSLAVEGQECEQRQITPAAIVPIEERELLGAVRLVVGRIQIDGDTPRPPVQATPMPLDDARRQLAPHPVERSPAPRRSRTARSSVATPADAHVRTQRFQTALRLARRHADEHLFDDTAVERVRVRERLDRGQGQLLAVAPDPRSSDRDLAAAQYDLARRMELPASGLADVRDPCRKPRYGWPRPRWRTVTPPCPRSAANSGLTP